MMSEAKDDPREVLQMLNSLGFVGITAQQLKDFMKDLKIYRKLKEREKQQWKEEMKNRIIEKQQRVMKEMLSESRNIIETSGHVTTESGSSVQESSINCHHNSVIQIKVTRYPDGKENGQSKMTNYNEELKRRERRKVYKKEEIQEPLTRENLRELERSQISKSATRMLLAPRETMIDDGSNARTKPARNFERLDVKRTLTEENVRNLERNNACQSRSKTETLAASTERQNTDAMRIKHKANPKEWEENLRNNPRPFSAPVISQKMPHEKLKATVSDPLGLKICTQEPASRKSFIRPWKLQPDGQRGRLNKKCDPVALYQKYQAEWKQIAFPGEERHSKLRWAVREKMLGSDPHPRPILKKSQSTTTVKKC